MKQLFSKLKKSDKEKNEVSNKKPAKKNNKKSLIIILSVVAIVIAGALVFHFKQTPQVASTNKNLPDEVKKVMEKDEEVVDVLPASERMIRSTDKGYLEDPFEAPMVLVGVLQNRASDDIATVRSGNTVYNVKEGDLIAGTWKVEEIYLDRIYLSSEGREIMLGMER